MSVGRVAATPAVTITSNATTSKHLLEMVEVVFVIRANILVVPVVKVYGFVIALVLLFAAAAVR